jgi:alpha-tubulin suppressor-like RCC1 family protein
MSGAPFPAATIMSPLSHWRERWGGNSYHQCTVPAELEFEQVVAVGCGDWHTAALTSGGKVVCWGSNHFRQWDVPPELEGTVVAISCGFAHSCALTRVNTIMCWGRTSSSDEFIVPAELGNVVATGAGHEYTAVVTSALNVVCWGNNDVGQCTVPPGLSHVVAVSCGMNNTVALTFVVLYALSWSSRLIVSRRWPNLLSQ